MKGYDKLRGGYYTPCEISEFITNWAISDTSESVLEPSCGDGGFIKALANCYKKLGKRIKRGLYRSTTRKINADVNGAYNIMVKENPSYIIGDRNQLRFNPILIKL